MNANLVCPMSFELVDHNASRVTCGLTIAALATFAATGSVFVAAPLAADYTIRAWTKDSSIMQQSAFGLARAVGIPEKPSDKAPKQFAARIGWLFAVAALLLTVAGATNIGIAVGLALAFFNVLDGVFDFCVGCWTYTYLMLPLQERVPALARVM